MLEDSQVSLLITQCKYEIIPFYSGKIVFLDDFRQIKNNSETEINLQTKFSKQELAQPEHLAYYFIPPAQPEEP